MGEHVIGTLANAIKTAPVSRKRALQLLGGAMAIVVPARVPQAAEARKHSKPPLAVASVVLVNVEPSGPNIVAWYYKGAVYPTDGGSGASLDTSTGFSATATADQARKHLVAIVRLRAADALKEQLGLTVPADRIAVTLL